MSRIDIGQNIRRPKVVAATAEGFYKATDDQQTGRICAELEDALEQKRRGELKDEEYKAIKDEKKKGCKFYTPHAHFNKGYKRSDGEPVDSGKSIIDLDGCEHFEQLYEQYLKGHERELGINMVNISVSKTGGHVLFDIPEGLTRQQAQAWMAHVLGDVAYDPAVHERERAVYIPCREYILYIDEELMFGDELHPAQLSDEELKRWKDWKTADAKKTRGKAEGTPKAQEIADHVRDEGTREDEDVAAGSTTLSSKPDERTRFIAKGVMKEKNLKKSDFLNEGGRHTTVKIFLGGATQLLSKAEVNGILSELMPEHWADENIQQLVEDFYKNYTNPSQKLYKYQEELFTQSQRLFGEESQAAQGIAGQARNEGSGMDDTNGTKDGIAPQALIAGKDPRSPKRKEKPGNRMMTLTTRTRKNCQLSILNCQLKSFRRA